MKDLDHYPPRIYNIYGRDEQDAYKRCLRVVKMGTWPNAIQRCDYGGCKARFLISTQEGNLSLWW